MRLKDLFTVPSGQKVTEKHMRRVLISSICSILLCMTCLVSTTWAWFAISIENEQNEIVTAELTDLLTDLTVRQGETRIEPSNDGSFSIKKDTEYELTITRIPNTDDLNQKMKFYGSFIIRYTEGEEDKTEIYRATIIDTFSISIKINTNAKLSIEVSWLEPKNGTWLTGDPITIEVEEPTEEPTEQSTEPTENTSEPTEAETEARKETTQPTEAETEATEETTQPTEAETEPTEETTQPTEAETEATEETTQPTEAETEPTEETTQPTEIETESAEETTQPGETTAPTENPIASEPSFPEQDT